MNLQMKMHKKYQLREKGMVGGGGGKQPVRTEKTNVYVKNCKHLL